MSPVLPHRRGLDGLRAFAVVAVLLYHAEVSWIPGGFLGVDVFFAISGYLITSLLLVEVASTGHVSLRRFWVRRARRLLPAVGALLVGVTLAALVGAHDAVARLRGDVLAALTYTSNWWQIVRGETYFETFGRPPLLRHLWSLAVEEQLYIALPLAVWFLARRRLLRHRRLLGLGAFALAGASLVALRAVWDPADPSRAWFGTDTRASSLLAGVGLALLWPMATRRHRTEPRRHLVDAVGIASLAGLTLLMLSVAETDDALSRWGFAATAVLSGALVVAITSPSSRLQRYLGIRPLQWIGTRSYAIYLWHWPVFALTRPRVDLDFGGWRVLAIRLLLTTVLAELSWRLVEQPWRTGAAWRAWWELRREVRVRVAVAATSAIAVLATALGVGLSSTGTERPELLATVAESPTTATTLARLPATTAPATTTTASTASVAPVPAPPAPTPAPTGPVLAVGDSVLLAARDALVQAGSGRVVVDAAVGRQVEDGLDVLQHYRDTGAFAQLSALVVHLGTNGPMSDDLFNRLAAIVDGVPRVVLLNVRVPKSWEGQSNAAINGGTTRFAAMRLADWYAASAEPGALAGDGVHPSPSGARIYAYITMRQVNDAPPATTTTSPPPPSTTSTTTAQPQPSLLPTPG